MNNEETKAAQVLLPPETIERIDELAELNRRSRSSQMRVMLEEQIRINRLGLEFQQVKAETA